MYICESTDKTKVLLTRFSKNKKVKNILRLFCNLLTYLMLYWTNNNKNLRLIYFLILKMAMMMTIDLIISQNYNDYNKIITMQSISNIRDSIFFLIQNMLSTSYNSNGKKQNLKLRGK